MLKKTGEKLEEWELAVFKKIARKARWKGFSSRSIDCEDLLQECMLHWVRARKTLDLSIVRDPAAFMRRVLENKIKDLIARETRIADGALVSYEAYAERFDGAAQADAATGTTLAAPLFGAYLSAEADRIHAALDLARALGALTPDQQALCEVLLDEGESRVGAARRSGFSRTKTYRELLRIRKTFLDLGLKN